MTDTPVQSFTIGPKKVKMTDYRMFIPQIKPGKTVYSLSFRISLCLLLLLPFGCGKVPIPEEGLQFDHFTGDFENGDLSAFHLLVPNDTNAVVIDSPVRKGNHAVRFFLRPEDRMNHGNRTELGVYNCAKYHTEVYYGWSFMIDTSYNDPHYCLFSQWQNLPDFGNGENWDNTFPSPPPLALVYADGEIRINRNEKVVNEAAETIAGKPVDKGVWHDIVFHVYWSDDSQGFVEAWLDGEPMISSGDHKYYGSNLYNRAGNYFKFGLYRGSDADEYKPLIAYGDELKIGSSYEEVKP